MRKIFTGMLASWKIEMMSSNSLMWEYGFSFSVPLKMGNWDTTWGWIVTWSWYEGSRKHDDVLKLGGFTNAFIVLWSYIGGRGMLLLSLDSSMSFILDWDSSIVLWSLPARSLSQPSLK